MAQPAFDQITVATHRYIRKNPSLVDNVWTSVEDV